MLFVELILYISVMFMQNESVSHNSAINTPVCLPSQQNYVQ
jgi:hypothetical protein